MKQTFLLLFLGGSIVAGVFALGVQHANALECSWTQNEYRCTEGYWTSEYQCTWYDPPPYQSCQPSTTYETQCGWEVQCDADDTNCKMVWVCKQVAVPSQNCTTVDPAPYQTCEWNSVWVPGSCGNYPTYKSQTCPANSETSCSYATDCSTSGTKNVTSYSCGSSGCVASTTSATCTRTFPTCTNNVGETGNVCGGSCTAPPNKTLSVSITATPSSGPAPLRNVKIDASVGGTATGTITYKLDCTNDGAFDDSATSSSTSFTFTKKCDYLTAGSYTAKVEATRQTLKATDTETIVAASVSLAADPSASTVAAKTNVTYTATSGFDVGPTPYYIRIYEGITQLQSCSTGTTCSYATSDTNRTRTFIAEIQDSSNNTITASSSISTTWQAAVQCAAPQSLSCAYNSSSSALTLSWGAVASVKDYFFEWTKWGSGYTFCLVPGCTPDSKTVSTTSGTTSSLSKNTTYKLRVRAETSTGSACSTPGSFSQEIECYTGTCNKTSTSRTDTFTVPVQTDTGAKNCTINVTHSGRDYYDSQLGRYDTNVSYQETACQRNLTTSSSNIQDISCQANSTTNSSTIAVDDDPVSGCNNNLVFTNSFDISTTGTLNAIGEVNSKDAGHDLAFGYEFSTSQCVITGVQGSGYTTINPDGSYWDTSALNFSPVISSDKKSASYQQTIYNNTNSTTQTSNFIFTLKECTQDSHCSSITNKTYCNGGETRNISASILPQNTCIDSIPPTATINETAIASGFKGSTPWFKAGTYNIPVTETDDNSGVNNTACLYQIKDLGTGKTSLYKTRTCGTTIPLNVDLGMDCQTEGEQKCYIEIQTFDRAGNQRVTTKLLNIDRTPPTAQ